MRAGAALLSVILVAFAPVAAEAGVVLGNLGASGTDALGSFGTDIESGATGATAAQSFAPGAGSTALQLNSVTLGMFAASTESVTLSLLGDSGGLPDVSNVIATSAATSVQAKNSYTFNFSGVTLTAGQTYWVTPVVVPELFWYTNNTFAAPSEQNTSQFTWPDSATSANGGTSWVAGNPSSDSLSFSVDAVAPVPEPSSLALGGLGLAGLAATYLRSRRRRRAAFETIAA